MLGKERTSFTYGYVGSVSAVLGKRKSNLLFIQYINTCCSVVPDADVV